MFLSLGSRDEYRKLRNVWDTKPQLQVVYKEWYKNATKFLRKGETAEIGCGIVNFKDYFSCTSIDIAHSGYEDICDGIVEFLTI